MTNNLAAALCYLLSFITGILFLVLAPYNKDPDIRFNAFQSIILGVGFTAIQWILGFLLSLAGVTALYFLLKLTALAYIVLCIYLMYSAYQGKSFVLPVIGPIAKAQK